MKQIEPQALLERIYPQRRCYFTEYVDLSRPEMIAKWAIRCYANESETCYAVTWKYPTWNVVNFIGYDRDFCNELLRQYKNTDGAFVLRPGEPLPKISIRGLKLDCSYESFSGEGPMPQAPMDPRIQLLTKEQHSILLPIAQRPEDLREEYSILAWMENGAPLGYISYSVYENVESSWDVSLIHVAPEQRGRGIGTKLAYAYLKTIREQGEIPYYSGVSNPHSAGAARRAGFQLCSTRHSFHYMRPKFNL